MGLLAELGQSGFSTSTKPLEERLQGMNPISGLKRLVSRKSLFELAKGLLKLAGVGVAAYLTLRATIPALFNVSGQPFERSILEAGGIIWDLLLKTGGVLIFLAAADYAYQRWEFEKSLRMSKEEVEKEVKETEGDPQLKARRRSQQRDLARSQMLEEIEDAEVVIANPTHFAVALGYNHHEDPAPVVLAKGRGYLALRIRELAEEHDVPVMEEPAVAQTLYKTAEVGQFIPSEMYEAVAEILALVWKMTGRIPDADADSAT
jgi:flagellar biosynthetic protein FlhB